ncbi:hypothetical protein BRD04_10560 [Halobacteriales archaeon QS_9_67_17]|nr:MAG: hypothetical protein BRD04_10560 [Halobacteriales archaeon QS_9_67_17]
MVVAALATIGAGWAYANPGTEQQTEQRHAQTVAADVESSAVATGETTLYEEGERLTDQRVYPLAANSTLTLTGAVDAPAETTVHQRLLVEYRATRDGRTVWQEQRVLAATEGGIDGEGGTVETTLNATRVRERLNAVRGELGAAATVQARLRYAVDYETDRYEGAVNATVPLGFTQQAYIVDGELAGEQTHSTPAQVTRQQSPDLPLVSGLLGTALVALGAASVLSRQSPEPAVTADELHRQRYAEWISSGRIPVYAADQYVEMSTLADLVNVAVDSNRRVIHDEEQAAYGIIDEGMLFWYAPGDGGPLAFASGLERPGDGFNGALEEADGDETELGELDGWQTYGEADDGEAIGIESVAGAGDGGFGEFDEFDGESPDATDMDGWEPHDTAGDGAGESPEFDADDPKATDEGDPVGDETDDSDSDTGDGADSLRDLFDDL